MRYEVRPVLEEPGRERGEAMRSGGVGFRVETCNLCFVLRLHCMGLVKVEGHACRLIY